MATTPARFLRAGRAPRAQRVVVCAGDSFTVGVMSANYLSALEDRLPGSQFINAGIDGDLAWNVLQRLDDVLACRPDAVTVLAGSNDIIGSLDPRWEKTYRRKQRIPQTPTLDWYVESMDAIIARLRSESAASVAVLDIPMLGEDLTSDINTRVEAYNEALRRVAASHGVPCLPLHHRLAALLPPDHTPPPFTARTGPMFSGWLVGHLILRRSWSEVGRRRGLAVLTDNVHLGEPAAETIADLIEEFLGPDKGAWTEAS